MSRPRFLRSLIVVLLIWSTASVGLFVRWPLNLLVALVLLALAAVELSLLRGSERHQ